MVNVRLVEKRAKSTVGSVIVENVISQTRRPGINLIIAIIPNRSKLSHDAERGVSGATVNPVADAEFEGCKVASNAVLRVSLNAFVTSSESGAWSIARVCALPIAWPHDREPRETFIRGEDVMAADAASRVS